MKKTRVSISIIFFLCLTNDISSKHSKKTSYSSPSSQLLSCCKELAFEKNLSLSKLIIIPTLVCSACLLNHQAFLNNMKENPLLTLIGSCILFNFCINTTIKYKQINHALCLFELSKIISRYMLYAIAIKNTMLLVSKKDVTFRFQEDDFFKTITNQIPLSFQELEQFVFELLHNCVKKVHLLHIKIHTDVEEKIYLLCKEHVTLEDVLYLYEDDTEFSLDLQKVLQNPTEHYKNAAFKLNTLIKEQFLYMIKQQPTIS